MPPSPRSFSRSSRHRAAYRPTLGDRIGGDAGNVYKAIGWTAAGALMIVPVALIFGPGGWPAVVTVPIAFVLTWALLFAGSRLIIAPPAAVARFYLAPTGESTPYEEQFSQ